MHPGERLCSTSHHLAPHGQDGHAHSTPMREKNTNIKSLRSVIRSGQLLPPAHSIGVAVLLSRAVADAEEGEEHGVETR